MGSYSRMYEWLKGIGVAKEDLTEVTNAIELLEGAGDDLSDILFMWYDGQESKDEAVDKAREHILKLQQAVDRIAISK